MRKRWKILIAIAIVGVLVMPVTISIEPTPHISDKQKEYSQRWRVEDTGILYHIRCPPEVYIEGDNGTIFFGKLWKKYYPSK